MNSDEYHLIDWHEDSPHYGICFFCGKEFGEHEHACPHHPDNIDNDTHQPPREGQ